MPLATAGSPIDADGGNRFPRRLAVTTSLGLFTDLYDLGVIATVLTLLNNEFHPSVVELGLVASTSYLSAVLGSLVFGWVSDRFGRTRIYGYEALLLAVAALASAFVPSLGWLIGIRFVLGLAIGGDYPTSVTLMSEYADQRRRGMMVGLLNLAAVIGSLVAPSVAILLLETGVAHAVVWRILLGLGAVPALVMFYLRRRCPESPRFTAQVLGDTEGARRDLTRLAGATTEHASATTRQAQPPLSLRRLLTTPRYLRLIVVTAGCWFLFDFILYGNDTNQQLLFARLAGHPDLVTLLGLQLLVAGAFHLPGSLLNLFVVDRIGHRRLGVLSFTLMGVALLVIAVFPAVAGNTAVFLVLFGTAVFASGFGVMALVPAEVFPIRARATGGGIAAGVGKVGAYVGALTVPLVLAAGGLRSVMLVAGLTAVAAAILTRVGIPEAAGRSLETFNEPTGDAAADAPARAEPSGLEGQRR